MMDGFFEKTVFHTLIGSLFQNELCNMNHTFWNDKLLKTW